MKKTPEAAYRFLLVASNNYQWVSLQLQPRTVAGVIEFDMASLLPTIHQRLDKLSTNSVRPNIVCESCACNHTMAKYPMGGTSNFDQVAYMRNSKWLNNPYSNSYNFGWRNHPNFS